MAQVTVEVMIVPKGLNALIKSLGNIEMVSDKTATQAADKITREINKKANQINLFKDDHIDKFVNKLQTDLSGAIMNSMSKIRLAKFGGFKVGLPPIPPTGATTALAGASGGLGNIVGALGGAIAPILSALGPLVILIAIGAAIATIAGVILSNRFVTKQIETLMKVLDILLRPVSFVIGIMLRGLIMIMLPFIRLMNQIFRPIRRSMMEAFKEVMKDQTLNPAQKMLKVLGVGVSTLNTFGSLLMTGVVSNIVKALIDIGIKLAQVITVVIGSGFVLTIKAIFYVAKLIGRLIDKMTFGATNVEGEVAAQEQMVLAPVIDTIVNMVTSLEILNQTLQVAVDMGVTAFQEAIMKSLDAQLQAITATSTWGEMLGGIAGIIDKDLGTAIQTGIEKATEWGLKLSEVIALQPDLTGKLDIFKTSIKGLIDEIILGRGIPDALSKEITRLTKQAIKDAEAIKRALAKVKGGVSTGSQPKTPSTGVTPYAEYSDAREFTKQLSVSTFPKPAEPAKTQSTFDKNVSSLQTGIQNAFASGVKLYSSIVGPLFTGASKALGYTPAGTYGDMVMTPGGQVIRTDPADYIFATKTPEKMAQGGGGDTTINLVVNAPSGNYEVLAKEIQNILRKEMKARSNTYTGSGIR